MRIRVLALLAVSLATRVHATPPQTRLFILGGHRAGQEIVATSGSTRTVDFEFNDRGRGPKTHTVMTADAKSITTSLKTEGNDYFKAPVSETFANGAWSNGAEKGSAASHAFYVSMYGPPEETAVLARALLAAPNQKLALLPAGEASIRRVGELTVSAAGKSQHVTCYEISGLGFTPSPVWLDDRRELFASASSWSSVIADGWDSVIPQLLQAQDKWRDEAVSRAARRLTHAAAGGGIVITNARLFDPITMTTTPATTIVIRGNRIESVGGAAPDGFERIDAKGRMVIPGLWDMHTHNSADDGMLDIANGVTSVRDMANDTDFLLDLRKKWDSGAAIGPRVVLAGIIDGPGKFAGPTKVLVDNADQARSAVDNYAKLGYEQIKIYSSVKPELVPVITAAAHAHGLRVSGHIPAFMRAEEAVRAGYDEIQHTNFLFLNFWPDVADTRTPVRFTAVAERAAALDLKSAPVQAFLDLLREKKTVIDPTVSIFEGMFTSRLGTMSPSYAMIADRLPPQVRRGFLTGGLPVPEGKDQTYRDSFRNVLAMVKALYDNHIPIVAGTDAMAGFSLHRELELYVQAGIPAAEALRIATLGAAAVMKHDDILGSIAPGKLADLDIIDGDPSTNISDIRRVVTVIKDGKVFDARAVAAEIGVRTQ
ncbi:MAG TPA: amidohydrolase family protein, partial [Thermoanaerobaculia bacterium]|nr:amidohydrolase family protein [Thermoanaerobaculia bacterium]